MDTTKIYNDNTVTIPTKKEPTNKKEEYCNVKLETLLQLKDSTKKLLCLIDDLQKKSSKATPVTSAFTEENITMPILEELTNHLDELPETSSIKQLEDHIKEIDKLGLESVHDCSIYERLTRKCNCLNRTEFNDFIIHFNEETKYSTSDLGEIIKNIRIVKKFLYMGGGYSKNALIFLNEGLTKCPHSERVDILLACSHADICNVFSDESFVKILIRAPMIQEGGADNMMQTLAARVLYRIAVVEEGRRYLNFNSKISTDIKQVLRRGSGQLNDDTKEFLNSSLNSLSPSTVPLINSSYCKAQEGVAKKILNSLQHFRVFMTLEEIFDNLELLNKLCDSNKGLSDMRQNLKCICTLFKDLLLKYDSSDMNVIITSIMNKLMRGKIIERNAVLDTPKSYIVTDTATEPTEVKDKLNQAPSHNIFKNLKKNVKSRLGIYMKSNRSLKLKKKHSTVGHSEFKIDKSKTNHESNISRSCSLRKEMEPTRIANKSKLSRNFSIYV